MREEEEEGMGWYALCVGREEWDTARKRERRAGGFFSLILSPNTHFPAFTASRPTFARSPSAPHWHWVFGFGFGLAGTGDSSRWIRYGRAGGEDKGGQPIGGAVGRWAGAPGLVDHTDRDVKPTTPQARRACRDRHPPARTHAAQSRPPRSCLQLLPCGPPVRMRQLSPV